MNTISEKVAAWYAARENPQFEEPAEQGKAMTWDVNILRRQLFGDRDIYDGFDASAYGMDVTGWNSTSPVFAELLSSVECGRVLEIGSWMGASAIHMAGLVPDAHILCVDTWLGSTEFVGSPKWGHVPRELHMVHGWPHVYYRFLANVVLSNNAGRITPFPMDSRHACQWLHQRGFKFDAVYVDAGHEVFDVVDDIAWAIKLVRPGGVVFGDDYNPTDTPGVVEAVSAYRHTVLADGKWKLNL